MIPCMPVIQAEVQHAAVTCYFNKLLLFASFFATSIGVNFPFLNCWITCTIIVNVMTDCNVRHLSFVYRHWNIAQWTYRHLHILLVGRWAVVLGISEMIFAEYSLASITLYRQKINLPAKTLRAMLSKIRKLHFQLFLNVTRQVSSQLTRNLRVYLNKSKLFEPKCNLCSGTLNLYCTTKLVQRRSSINKIKEHQSRILTDGCL